MEVLITDKMMIAKEMEKRENEVKQVELVRPGVVKIPYSINNEQFEIIIYQEKKWYVYEVKELKKGIWKILKNKNEWWITIKDIKNEKNFMDTISSILDYYVGTPRILIPEKAKKTYTLLYQEEINKEKERTKKNIRQSLQKKEPEVDLVSDDSIQKYISEYTPIEETYTPTDLEEISSEYLHKENDRIFKLRKEANTAIGELAKAFMKRFEWDQIEIYSAYRDKKKQETLYETFKDKGTVAKKYSSEHELWLTVDIRIKRISGRKINLEKDNVYKDRLRKHAHKYGFHNTYQKGIEIDKINKEWWHRRYLGKELATRLAENNLSLAEYYNKKHVLSKNK